MDQFGPNALGETLEPGRVTDCYFGLLLPPGPVGEPEAGTVLVVTPAALLHAGVPQPAGSLVYELLTGHPEREPGELVFVADLTVELRAWPKDTWTAVGVDPGQVAMTVIGCWQDGEVTKRMPSGKASTRSGGALMTSCQQPYGIRTATRWPAARAEVGPGGADHPGGIHAGGEGQGHLELVGPGGLEQVGERHSGGDHVDDHPVVGPRLLDLGPLNRVWAREGHDPMS